MMFSAMKRQGFDETLSKRGTALRAVLVSVLVLAVLAPSLWAATPEFSLLLDLDDQMATGCSVATADGAFDGVEQILVTTVDNTSGDPQVISVATRDCVDPGTGTFGPPVIVDMPYAPPWPVAVGAGTDGSDGIETYWPADIDPNQRFIRVAAISSEDGEGEEDAILGLGLVEVGGLSVLEIPTLGTWGLFALALVLSFLALRILRRHPSTAAALVAAVLLFSAAGAVWAGAGMFMPDGDLSEWAAIPPLGIDGSGDAGPDADLIAVFAAVDETQPGLLFVRFDAVLNDCPTAADDAVATDADVVLGGDVLADNGSGADDDPEGQGLTITEVDGDPASVGNQVTLASGALLTVNADGTFSYDPNGQFDPLAPGESATDGFSYTVEDDLGCADGADVTITINGVNDCPTAVDDDVTTDEDTLLNGDVTVDNGNGADSDPKGDSLVVTEVNGNAANVGVQVTLASGALLTVNADGTFAYDPNGQFESLGAGETDTDSFTYTIDDGSGTCSETATVTVTLTGVNDCPVAVDDAVSTDQDTVLNGDVLVANPTTADSDAEGDTLVVTEINGSAANVGVEITLASGALVTVNSDGTFSYDPNGQFDDLGDGESDTDSFTYTLDDGSGTCSETATVTVTINGANDCPTAVDDAVSTDEDTVLNGDVTAANPTTADSDPEGDTLAVTEVNGNAANVGVEITLASGALLTVNSNGTFSYDPNGQFDALAPGDTDTDTFTYTLDDGSGTCSETATVTVTLTGVNDCPVAVNDAATTDEATVVNGDVLAANPTTADSDPEGDALTVTAVNGNAANVGVQIALGSGALVTVNANGTFSYDPNGAFNDLGIGDSDTDTFTYTIDDGSGTCAETATVTVTVTGLNDCPTAVDDAVSTDEDTVLNGDVTAANPTTADSDPEGDTLTVTAVNGNAANVGVQIALGAGLLTVNANGTFSFDPNDGYEALTDGDMAQESFTYTIDDGSGTCAETATVTVTINGINDAPTVVGESYDTVSNTLLEVNNTAQASAPSVFVMGNLLANDSDVDGPGALNPSLNTATPGAVVVINANGEFTYLPPAGLTGTDSFTYDVSDGSVAGTGTVTITFTGRAWYVENDAAAGGLGRSADPFDTLAEAETAHGPNDLICVRTGDGTSTGHEDGIQINHPNVRLHGEHHGCDFNVGLNGNAAPTVLVPPSAGNHPQIDHTSGGNAVTVLASAASLPGVEIRGLDLDADDNAIDVRAENAVDSDVTIENNIIRGATNEGIDLESATTGTLTVAVRGNDITSTGNGVDAVATTGTVEIAVTGQTGISSTATGVRLNGSGAGNLFVTEFANNVVDADTGGNGVHATGVTFDADPSDADFTGDAVSGALAVGTSGDGVGGSGVLLTDVGGDLSFTSLNVHADGGAGVMATAAGALNAGAGTGFRVTAPAGSTITAIGGPGLSLDPLTAAVSALVMSTGSSTDGAFLGGVEGTVTFEAGSSIAGAAGHSFHVDGGGSTVVFNGNINHGAAAFSAVRVVNTTAAASATLQSGTVTATAGSGVVVNNAAGDVSVADLDAGTSATRLAANGISIGGSSGTYAFTDAAIFTNAATGLLATGGGTINVDPGGTNTVSVNTTGAPAINVNGPALAADFDSVAATNGAGAGVNLANTFGVKAFRSLTSTTTNGRAFSASSAGSVIVTGAANTLSANSNRALHIENTLIGAAGAQFRSIAATTADIGIFLSSTGTTAGTHGGLTVTGTGAANSGGQITGSTDDGVRLASTRDVSLTEMRVANSANNHFDLNNVHGLVLDSALLDQSGSHGILGATVRRLEVRNNSLIDRSGNSANEHGINITNLLETSSIRDTTFRRSSTIHAIVRNTSATTAAPATPTDILTISGSTFEIPVAGTFGDNVSVESATSGNFRLVTDASNGVNTFTGGQDGIQATTATGGTLDVSVTGVNVSGNTGVGVNVGGFNSSDLTFDVFENKTANGTGIANTGSIGINTTSIGGARLSGRVFDNTINGSTAGQGVQTIVEGNGSIVTNISNNDIDNVQSGFGIRVQARAGSGRIDATIGNNDVNLAAAAFPLEGIGVESGSSAGGDTNVICLNLLNNTSVSNFNEGYRLRHRAGTTFQLQDFVGVGSNPADVTTWVNTTKSNTGTVQVTGTGFIAAPGACTTP